MRCARVVFGDRVARGRRIRRDDEIDVVTRRRLGRRRRRRCERNFDQRRLRLGEKIPADAERDREQHQHRADDAATAAQRLAVGERRGFDVRTVVVGDFDQAADDAARIGDLALERRRHRQLAERMIGEQVVTEESLGFVGVERHQLVALHAHLVLLRQLAQFVESLEIARDDQVEPLVDAIGRPAQEELVAGFFQRQLEMIGDDDVAGRGLLEQPLDLVGEVRAGHILGRVGEIDPVHRLVAEPVALQFLEQPRLADARLAVEQVQFRSRRQLAREVLHQVRGLARQEIRAIHERNR